MTKQRVLLVYGGESSEHEVSIKSAHNIYAAIDNDRYVVELCYIDKTGRWWLVDNIDGRHVGHPQLVPVLGQQQFITLPDERTIRPDVILPVLHGRHGEDGTVQGLAQLLHIPCAGPGLLGAAVTMDKDVTKRILQQAGIPVVSWQIWRTNEEKPRFETVVEQFGVPLFVKPANAGSSVGVHRVETADEWKTALEDAAQYDTKILIEPGVSAREIELAVLGNVAPKVSGAGEVVPGEAFYSYDDKYAVDSVSHTVIPANIDHDILNTLQDYALRAYTATSGRGIARVDFFIDKQTNEVFLNEINSIPGFTDISMYPKLWQASGLSYAELIETMISLADKE